MNDYFRLRARLNLAAYPDEMVRDTAREVELKALEAGLRPDDIAWLVEAASRAEPRVNQVLFTDNLKPREGLG